MTVIGITGRRGSGKDTVANMLTKQGYENIKFAGALKEMLRTYLRYVGMNAFEIERHIEGPDKEKPIPQLSGQNARRAMQTLGTEWGRNLMGPDMWVNSFLLRCNQFPRVVCSDVRFPNEADMIHELGGKIIRLTRPGLPQLDHPSENLIDELVVDYVILNNSTTESLREQVLLITERIKHV